MHFSSGNGLKFSGFKFQSHGREWNPYDVEIAPFSHIALAENRGMSGTSVTPVSHVLWPENGLGISLAVAWSGNWTIDAKNDHNQIYLKAGLNAPDTPFELSPDEKLNTPWVHVVFSEGGLENAGNALTKFARDRCLPDTHTLPHYPTLNHLDFYGMPNPDADANNVELTSFDAIASRVKMAAELGIELFDISTSVVGSDVSTWNVLHDSFDPAEIRFDKSAGKSLHDLVDLIHEHNMEAGFWIDPEWSPSHTSSEVIKEHPDWIFQKGKDGRILLDFRREDVCLYIGDRIIKFIEKYNFDALFWDMNTTIPSGESMIDYYASIYKIHERIIDTYPGFRFLTCSGGGRRADYGMIKYSHAMQISDCVHPVINLLQAWTYSLYFPIALMERYTYNRDWSVFEGAEGVRKASFILKSAMMGSFSSSVPVQELKPEIFACIKEHNSWYKEHLRPIIANADVFRLSDYPNITNHLGIGQVVDKNNNKNNWAYNEDLPTSNTSDWFVFQEFNKDLDESAVFIFQLQEIVQNFHILPKAFQEEALYTVRSLEEKSERILSGKEIMNNGFIIEPKGALYSDILIITKKD